MKKEKRVDVAVRVLSSILEVVQKSSKDQRESIPREEFSKLITDIRGHATTAFISLTVRPEHLDLTLESLQKGRI